MNIYHSCVYFIFLLVFMFSSFIFFYPDCMYLHVVLFIKLFQFIVYSSRTRLFKFSKNGEFDRENHEFFTHFFIVDKLILYTLDQQETMQSIIRRVLPTVSLISKPRLIQYQYATFSTGFHYRNSML